MLWLCVFITFATARRTKRPCKKILKKYYILRQMNTACYWSPSTSTSSHKHFHITNSRTHVLVEIAVNEWSRHSTHGFAWLSKHKCTQTSPINWTNILNRHKWQRLVKSAGCESTVRQLQTTLKPLFYLNTKKKQSKLYSFLICSRQKCWIQSFCLS